MPDFIFESEDGTSQVEISLCSHTPYDTMAIKHKLMTVHSSICPSSAEAMIKALKAYLEDQKKEHYTVLGFFQEDFRRDYLWVRATSPREASMKAKEHFKDRFKDPFVAIAVFKGKLMMGEDFIGV